MLIFMNAKIVSPDHVRSSPDITAFERSTYRKVTRRLIPFLFLCYILSYVDRVNVSFAKLEMQQDLGMSDTVFGAGMGIFFIGYFFFEVPSNMILRRIGARRWIGPLMIVWGFVSSSFMFARTPVLFYLLRFLLGIVESGFFPGVVLYLTFWYPGRYRAKMVAAFMSAIALAGAFGSPLSGWIMSSMVGVGDLAGWQWLFLLEGVPSILCGTVALFYLVDGPETATWLTPEQQSLLVTRLREDEKFKQDQGLRHHTLRDVFRSRTVWQLCLVYFGIIMGNYFISFWMPQLIKDTFATDPWHIGMISVLPWGFGAVVMIFWGHHSDATGERRWHFALACLLAAVFFIVSGIQGLSPVFALAALALATAGVMAGMSTFWALPTAILSGTAAAAGIAWINSLGNLAGFVSPYVTGWIRDTTHNPMYAVLVLAASCVMSAVLVLVVSSKPKTSPQ
jgi:D-galactonate transporter